LADDAQAAICRSEFIYQILSIFVILLLLINYFNPSLVMSDLDRGIMKFKGADSPLAIAISSIVVLGSILLLIVWAMQHAYAV
jgi:hypothetical protein